MVVRRLVYKQGETKMNRGGCPSGKLLLEVTIYCITCTLCNKLYIGETGRRLGDRFREHLCDVEKNDKDASKPVAITTPKNTWLSAAFPYI